jgi:hypothetical protein
MEQSTVHLEKLVDLLAQLITFTDVSSAGPRTPPRHDDAERPTTDPIMLAFLRAFSNERLCDPCLGHSTGKFDRDVAAGVSVLLSEGHVPELVVQGELRRVGPAGRGERHDGVNDRRPCSALSA